jgi:serine protease Do
MSARLHGFLISCCILSGLFLGGCSSEKDHLKGLDQGIAEILGKAGPSVVSISVRNQELNLDKIGSGIIIDDNHIITIENLLQDVDEITIKLQDGTQISDSNIFIHGCDFETDLSLLQIERQNLKPAKMAEEIKNGSLGIVLGNTEYSKGLQVNLGTVGNSWIGGVDAYDDNLLVLSAPCAPFNPGTPVFNSKAELIGLIEGEIEGKENVVLLVPSTTISRVSAILKKDGEIKRGWIGISSKGICKREKAVVSDVIEGSPAHIAGLKKGDLVVACNGKEVENTLELKRMISKLQKGTSITLEIQRDGSELTKELTVEWAKNLPRKRRCPDRSI